MNKRHSRYTECVNELLDAGFEEDIKHYNIIMSELLDAYNKGKHPVITCPWCNGKGIDGLDRCDPPNEYMCQFCGGTGKVRIEPFGWPEDTDR